MVVECHEIWYVLKLKHSSPLLLLLSFKGTAHFVPALTWFHHQLLHLHFQYIAGSSLYDSMLWLSIPLHFLMQLEKLKHFSKHLYPYPPPDPGFQTFSPSDSLALFPILSSVFRVHMWPPLQWSKLKHIAWLLCKTLNVQFAELTLSCQLLPFYFTIPLISLAMAPALLH